MRIGLYLRTYAVQLKNNWVREVVYRSNFVTAILVDLIWIGLEFSLFNVLYSNTPLLAGWTREQSFFFLGIFFTVDSSFTVFFQRSFWTFPDLVNKGELDILLTKPIHPLFLALTRWISMTSIVNILLGIGIMVTYADAAGFPGGWHWFRVVGWVAYGLLAEVLLRFMFSIWVFWTERGWSLGLLYYQFFQFASKPDALYPGVIRYVLLTVLPFALIGSIPARALLFGLTGAEVAVATAVPIAFFTVLALLWRAGLRRYQSASS